MRPKTLFEAHGVEALPQERLEPHLRLMLDYWRGKRQGGGLPSRRDIDPVDIVPALGLISLWELTEDGEQYVCRLAGTRICTIFGREIRGLTLEEVHRDRWREVSADFALVRRLREPHYVERPWSRDDEYTAYQRLLLPLAEDGETVDTLLAVLAYQ